MSGSSETGRLIFLLGASGSGKDSLINALRHSVGSTPRPLLAAHRYITRPWQAGGENHLEISEVEFGLRVEHGLFSLHWQANGHHYGLGREIHDWLASGPDVIVNGSRRALTDARRCFGARLMPVVLSVREDVLADRLRARGRESEEEIQARLARHRQLSSLPELKGCARLENNHTLESTLAALSSLLHDNS